MGDEQLSVVGSPAALAPIVPWEDRIYELQQLKACAAMAILLYYWEIGRFTDDVRASRYGFHVVEDIAEALGVSTSTIYTCSMFHRLYSPEEARQAVEARLPWRVITLLLGEKNPVLRKGLQEKYVQEHMRTTDFESLLSRARDVDVRHDKAAVLQGLRRALDSAKRLKRAQGRPGYLAAVREILAQLQDVHEEVQKLRAEE